MVGIVGALIGNALAGPLLGVRGSIQEFSLTGLLIAVVGAIVLLGHRQPGPARPGPLTSTI